jgi:hypothetical protein
MESPEGAAKPVVLDDVFEMTVEELRQELEKQGYETKAMTKIQMQKALAKMVSPVSSKEEWKLKAKSLELKAQTDAEERKEDREYELKKLEIEQKKIEAE